MSKMFFYIDSMQMGGAQRVMSNLCDHFSEAGNEVVLINDIVPVKDKPEYEINSKVRRIFLDEGVNYTGIKKNLHRISRLRKIVKQENPDLILSFIGPPNIRMLVSLFGLKVKKYTSVRNDPYKEYGSGIKKLISKLIFNTADGCVFQTEDAKKYFFKKLQNKSTVIFNPVREDFFDIKHEDGNGTVVTVGRLNVQKNHALAIKAFSKVCGDFPQAKFLIYGEGELREDLQKLIDSLDLSERVILCGLETNISEKLNDAEIFILSSDYEGMPNALMEAMAAGVPSISTDCPCGGPKMLIKSEDEGILVPCGDENEMAFAIKKLLEDKALRDKISIGAKKRAEVFRTDKILSQWTDFLKSR